MFQPKLLPSTIAALAVGLSLASCLDDGRAQRLDEEIRSLNESLFQAQQELSRIKSQTGTMEAERSRLKEDKAKLEGELEEARKALDALRKDFESYKNQYKLSIRSRAPGMNLGTVIVNEREYKQVTIRELTEDSVAVLHDAGTAKFALADLPEKLQRFLGYEKPVSILSASVAYGSELQSASTSPASPMDARDAENAAIKAYDAEVLKLDESITKLRIELSSTNSELSNSRHLVALAQRQNTSEVVHQRAVNAYLVKATKIESELRQLEEKRRVLLANNPRRRRG